MASNHTKFQSATDAFALRLPTELRERVKTAAEDERRSMNSQIIVLLEQALDQKSKAEAAVTAPAQ